MDSLSRLTFILPGVATAAFLAILIVPASALAGCVTGAATDYNDIDAILYTVRYNVIGGSREGLNGYRPGRMADSSLWALWAPWRETGDYAQFSLPGEVGTYEIAATLKDATEVLRDDRFYELSPPFDNVLDGTHSVLTVRRCSVVTRIIISNGDATFADAPTRKLFGDMLHLIDISKKDKVSDTPLIFEQKLLFDQ